MCCRYVLLQEHSKLLLEKLGALLDAAATPAALPPSRYNIAPGAPALAVRRRPSSPTAALELVPLHWGLVPAWSRVADNPHVNARAETLADKPAFRDAARARRCLIPASGFYEWEPDGRSRRPWLFRLRDEQPFFLAGLWESWRAPDGDFLETCAVVTTAPNELMASIHHRMPVLLAEPAAWQAWLDPRIEQVDTLSPLLRPFSSHAMTALAVNPRVNSIRHDAPDCLEPARENQLGFDLGPAP